LKVDAIEQVLFVAFVVHHHELRRIQEPACVQTADGMNSPQFLPP
jgi:hypothetical protein